MKVVASIEARMGSSRLPGKSIRKILDKPMLELMIERVKECKEVDDIVVATSSNKKDNVIAELASKLDVNYFRGSENDVLDRVLNAAKMIKADVIVELWGDCPLIDPEILDDLVTFYKKKTHLYQYFFYKYLFFELNLILKNPLLLCRVLWYLDL